MWIILGLCTAVAGAGLASLIAAVVSESYLLLTIGVTAFGVGTHQMIATVKEKANLDLLSDNFEDLSESARSEILGSLVKHNARASKGILGFIETIFERSTK